jgi:hypothetical protein
MAEATLMPHCTINVSIRRFQQKSPEPSISVDNFSQLKSIDILGFRDFIAAAKAILHMQRPPGA